MPAHVAVTLPPGAMVVGLTVTVGPVATSSLVMVTVALPGVPGV